MTLKTSTSVADPPKGWPNLNYDPSQPFLFFRLPENVRHHIISYLVSPINSYRQDPESAINPFYNWGSVYLKEEEACEATNIDTSILYVGNKAWYFDTAQVLYGKNIFALTNPTVADWWLHRIGPNLDRLTGLSISISTGKVDGPNGRDTRREVLWLKVLHWLKDRHQLKRLGLDFEGWHFVQRNSDMYRWWHDCARWREEIVLTLLGFRGLEQVDVLPGFWHREDENWPSVYGSVWEDIEEAMELPRGSRFEAEERMRGYVRRERDRQGLKGLEYSFG